MSIERVSIYSHLGTFVALSTQNYGLGHKNGLDITKTVMASPFFYLNYHFRAFIIHKRLLKDPISTGNAHFTVFEVPSSRV